MDIITDDIVASKGRIKVLQAGRKRFVEFGQAKVLDINPPGITVSPVGRRATFACRPEDLEVVEPANRDLQQTLSSTASGEEVAEANKGMSVEPGTLPVVASGNVVVEQGEAEPLTPAEPEQQIEGSIAVTGQVTTPKGMKPKKTDLKALREKKRQAEPKPKPKPSTRRRRDR